jgi:hypothetical protein
MFKLPTTATVAVIAYPPTLADFGRNAPGKALFAAENAEVTEKT